MSEPFIDTRAARFLDYLRRNYSHDRGALARLRGGLSAARKPNVWPLLGAFPNAIGNEAFETVAALWADDSDANDGGGNLGASLQMVSADLSSFEGRFKRLLTCDRNEIASRVASLVRAAQAKGARIHYARLLSDLLHWNDRTRIEWAKAYWSAEEPPTADLDADLSAGDPAP